MKRRRSPISSGVLRRDDEPELMPVLSPALDEGAAVRFVLDRRIGAALFSFAGHPVAFEIAQMRVGRAARDAAHLWAAAPPALRDSASPPAP